MITLLLSPVAHASGGTPICALATGSWESQTEACACMRTTAGSQSWWGGVNLSATPQNRVTGTCFDMPKMMASVDQSTEYAAIRNALDSYGHNIASFHSYMWVSSDPSSLLSSAEMDTWGGGCVSCHAGGVDGENPHDDDEPASQFVIDTDLRGTWTMWTPPSLDSKYGDLVATVSTSKADVSHAFTADVDEDKELDLVIVLDDGGICEQRGPFDAERVFECIVGR